jgi:predicted ATPase
VRGALERHGGVEVDTQGDAFFCSFGSARSAVACAADVLAALAPGPVRVRVGIHTGEALVVDRHYVGMDVHRAARIGSCGHGGQVVLSPTTVALLDPDEFDVRELGAHRLKDLAARVVLSQLGDATHPPLKTLFRTNLPVPSTPFLGRARELAELVALASEPGVRLLTLTGPGGTGKTRLALQLAAELSDGYPDGTWWVPLAPLRDGTLVASATARALDVDEESDREITDAIANALAHKRLLLVVDNCEHVVEPVASLVSQIVRSSVDVFVVATSREPLAISGEHVVPVSPLVEDDAVELFRTRARAAGAALDVEETNGLVGQLCARLDNLPLAVELAAARAAVLPPAALLERLSSGLDVLKGPRDVDERQRTLRGTIAWSHGLLEPAEQQLFARLAVFVGGGSLDAIENVCRADIDDLLSLVSKSLVRESHVDAAEPRYWMLETIREFAVEQLRASGEDDVGERHLRWFADQARAFRRAAETSAPDGQDWLGRMELDVSNLRAAFEFAVDEARAEEVIELAMALWISHQARGRYAEAADVARHGLGFAPEPLEESWLREALGRVLRLQGHPAEALEAFEASERALELMTDRGVAWWERWVELGLTKATFFYFENRQAELDSLVEELDGWVRDHGTATQQVDLLHLRVQQAYRRENYAPSAETEALAREAYERALEVNDWGADFVLGFCLLWRNKLDEAERRFASGREAARSTGPAILETRCLVYGAIARRRQNDLEGTREWLAALDAQDDLHGYRGLAAATGAWVAYRDGDLERAVARGAEALADWQTDARSGSRVFEWTARFPLLGVALAKGDVEAAFEHARAMIDDSQQPLPAEISTALEHAVRSARAEDLHVALELARSDGYA